MTLTKTLTTRKLMHYVVCIAAYVAVWAGIGGYAIAHEKPVINPVKSVAAPSAENAKVIAVINQLREAISSGDAAMVERVMMEDITIYEQGHIESSRAEYLDHHFKQDVAFAKAAPSIVVSLRAKVNGNMALVTANTTTDGVFQEKPVKNAGVETYVLHVQDGVWRIRHIHWSSRKRA